MDTLAKLEACIGGIFIALAAALGPERKEVALDLLWDFAGDHRLSEYERGFYKDLFETVEMAGQPVGTEELFEHLATVH